MCAFLFLDVAQSLQCLSRSREGIVAELQPSRRRSLRSSLQHITPCAFALPRLFMVRRDACCCRHESHREVDTLVAGPCGQWRLAATACWGLWARLRSARSARICRDVAGFGPTLGVGRALLLICPPGRTQAIVRVGAVAAATASPAGQCCHIGLVAEVANGTAPPHEQTWLWEDRRDAAVYTPWAAGAPGGNASDDRVAVFQGGRRAGAPRASASERGMADLAVGLGGWVRSHGSRDGAQTEGDSWRA